MDESAALRSVRQQLEALYAADRESWTQADMCRYKALCAEESELLEAPVAGFPGSGFQPQGGSSGRSDRLRRP